ncbi:MAG: type II toxin-antitoxin system VapC family toxin [Chloroflexota bacterium]
MAAARARGTNVARAEVAYADTNLFVALFVGSTHPLHDRALGIFRRVAEGSLVVIVTAIVVAELVYVSRDVIGWSRAEIADRLDGLLDADGVISTEPSVLRRALALYGNHSKLDFADAYLGAVVLEVGPAAVASFDADFDVIPTLRRVSA